MEVSLLAQEVKSCMVHMRQKNCLPAAMDTHPQKLHWLSRVQSLVFGWFGVFFPPLLRSTCFHTGICGIPLTGPTRNDSKSKEQPSAQAARRMEDFTLVGFFGGWGEVWGFFVSEGNIKGGLSLGSGAASHGSSPSGPSWLTCPARPSGLLRFGCTQ